MTFSREEEEFLRSQRIARLATVSLAGWPHVVPVMYELKDGGFEFDADGVKLRNLEHEPRAALVVDTMGPRRGVAVQGRTRVIGPERVRLDAERHFSWGF
ncbi:MAG: pyridoxamine 5'-phosphate oxidase family protein [Chloroflexota bacterium]